MEASQQQPRLEDMEDNYRSACDLCKRRKVRCIGSVSGGACVNCTKRHEECRFGMKKRPGPKPVKRRGGSRGKSSGSPGRKPTGPISSRAGRGASAVVKSALAKDDGIVGSGGNGRTVNRSHSTSIGKEKAASGGRPVAAGSVEDGGDNDGGDCGAGWLRYLDGGRGGVEAVPWNGAREPPLAVGLSEKKHDEVEYAEVEYAARSSPSNLTRPRPQLSSAAGVCSYGACSPFARVLPAFPPFFDESGGGSDPAGLTGTPRNGCGGVVGRESCGGGERSDESFSGTRPATAAGGRGTPFAAPVLEGSASGGGGAAPSVCSDGGVGGGTGDGNTGAHGSLFLKGFYGDQSAGVPEMPAGVGGLYGCTAVSDVAGARASSCAGNASTTGRGEESAVASGERGGGPSGTKEGNRLPCGAGEGTAATVQARTLCSARDSAAGVGRVQQTSEAPQVGGGPPAHPFGLSLRPAAISTFGDGGGNGGKYNARVAAGTHGGGGPISGGVHSTTCYGGEAAVPLPFLSQGGGCRYNQAPMSRAERILGAARNGRSFVHGLSGLAQEDNRTALHAFPTCSGNGPLGSRGGGSGGGGSFCGYLPALPLQESDLKWIVEICVEDHGDEQQQQQQQPNKKRKVEQQPPTEPDLRCPRPVDGPIKRRKKLDQAVLTAARADRTAAAAAAAISTPLRAAATPNPLHHQQPELPLLSRLASNIGDIGDTSRPFFSSRSPVALDGGHGGGGGGGIEVGGRSVAGDIFGRVCFVGSGGWQGHGHLPQRVELSHAVDKNGASPGNRNSSGRASGGRTQGGDAASQVDWESMYGPNGGFIGSLPPVLDANALMYARAFDRP